MTDKWSGGWVTTGNGVSHYWVCGLNISVGDVVTLREIAVPFRTWQGAVKAVNGRKAVAHLRYLGREVEEIFDGSELADVSVTVGGVSYPQTPVIIDPPGP